MLGSGAIHPDGADHVMRSKALPIDIQHQQVRLVPAPLAQLPQLFHAAFNGLAAHTAARYAHGFRHIREHFGVFTHRNPARSAPIMRCAVASFSCNDSYAGTPISPVSLCRSRGRFTLIWRSARLTRPFCVPCQRMSPLLLPGVRGPATCSALKVKMV